jgi:hypothetical protein
MNDKNKTVRIMINLAEALNTVAAVLQLLFSDAHKLLLASTQLLKAKKEFNSIQLK